MTDRMQSGATSQVDLEADTRPGRAPLSITIVMPCYNEANRLDLVQVDEFLEAHPAARFIFVDDKSTDSTRSVLQDYCAQRPNTCSLISLDQNSGKAEAVRQGMLAAFRSGVSVAGYWDADLAAPLRCVDELSQVLEVDSAVLVVLGSRVKMLGWRIHRKATRHYLGRVFATAVSVMLGVPVYDTQCGAKVFRNNPVVKGAFEERFVSRWIFDVEILARLLSTPEIGRSNFETFVKEQPLSVWRDVSGSKVRVRNFAEAPIELARIWSTGFRKSRLR